MSGVRYDAMTVRENPKGGRGFWTKIGAAFVNHDGSISVQLDALPVDGRLVLQVPLSREEKEQRYQNRQQDWGNDRSRREGPQPVVRGGGGSHDRYRSGPGPAKAPAAPPPYPGDQDRPPFDIGPGGAPDDGGEPPY